MKQKGIQKIFDITNISLLNPVPDNQDSNYPNPGT